jgi:hypothetical protein
MLSFCEGEEERREACRLAINVNEEKLTLPLSLKACGKPQCLEEEKIPSM